MSAGEKGKQTGRKALGGSALQTKPSHNVADSARSPAHHCVRLDSVDEDGHGPQPGFLEALDELGHVGLLSYDMLAVQQDADCGTSTMHSRLTRRGAGLLLLNQKCGGQVGKIRGRSQGPATSAQPQHPPVGAAGSRTGPSRSYQRM